MAEEGHIFARAAKSEEFTMFILGLTGGIASGKSTVSRMLTMLGAQVIDADKIARMVVEPGKAAWLEIVAHFGEAILQADQSIDRIQLGNIIFNDAKEKEVLERITHKQIQMEIERQLDECAKKQAEIVVLDVPLLYEVGWDTMVNAVWVVYVNEANQLKRLMQRNHWSADEAKARISSQMCLAEKSEKANLVIDNNGDFDYTREQVLSGWKSLQGGLKGNDIRANG